MWKIWRSILPRRRRSLAAVLPQAPGAVAIDFTAPAVSLQSARAVAESGHALVIGTTGFTDAKDELHQLAKKAPIFWASNMSIGVNVLCKILPELTRALGDAYDIEMVELHHNRKKDGPSGLTLGECVAEARDGSLTMCAALPVTVLSAKGPKPRSVIQAMHGGDVVGVHTVYFMGPGERIEVTHGPIRGIPLPRARCGRLHGWPGRSRASFMACAICSRCRAF